LRITGIIVNGMTLLIPYISLSTNHFKAFMDYLIKKAL